jgi:predicted CXXCH cytochrome family protein
MRLDTRYALWGAALALVAIMPLLSGFSGFVWELSQFAGLVGCLACIALCGAPLRPRASVPPTLVSLRLHTLIGWVGFAAVVVHAGGLLLADPIAIEYWKPSMPLYQMAGFGSGLVFLIVVVSSGAGARRCLWANHRGFQATHVILGCLLAAGVAVHVITTDRYVGGGWRRALMLAATLGALLMLLRFRRPSSASPSALRVQRRLVFGRHSSLILGVVVITAVAVAAMVRGSAVAALREPLIHRRSPIPLDFPHGKHVAVNCLICHHNFADGRGFDECVGCHRSQRADLKEGVEAQFHGFCFECHRRPAVSFTRHGPVSGCVSCHHKPDKAN